jgi:hypothetical protein
VVATSEGGSLRLAGGGMPSVIDMYDMVAGDCSWPISHVVLHYGVL